MVGQVLDAGLGLFLGGDVATQPHERRPAVIEDAGRAHLHRQVTASGVAMLGLKGDLSLLGQAGNAADGMDRLLGGVDVGDMALEECLAGVAILAAGLFVHVDDLAVQIDDQDGLRRMVIDQTVALLAGLQGGIGRTDLGRPGRHLALQVGAEFPIAVLTLPQGQFRLLTVGDVVGHHVDADYLTGRILEGIEVADPGPRLAG